MQARESLHSGRVFPDMRGVALGAEFAVACSPGSCNPACRCLKEPPKSIVLHDLSKRLQLCDRLFSAVAVAAALKQVGVVLVLTTQSLAKGPVHLLCFLWQQREHVKVSCACTSMREPLWSHFSSVKQKGY